MTDPGKPISEPVDRFLARYVGSIEQLEILRVLGENPGTEWAAGDMARENQVPPATIQFRVGDQAAGQLQLVSTGHAAQGGAQLAAGREAFGAQPDRERTCRGRREPAFIHLCAQQRQQQK